jgi:hypothetical protein
MTNPCDKIGCPGVGTTEVEVVDDPGTIVFLCDSCAELYIDSDNYQYPPDDYDGPFVNVQPHYIWER